MDANKERLLTMGGATIVVGFLIPFIIGTKAKNWQTGLMFGVFGLMLGIVISGIMIMKESPNPENE